MKGLLKILSPFAPDQSGATAVFYDMNCITVICDAGGCTGNICGFDEPRWNAQARPIFSAGLRDMDAILGRDDKLVDKLRKVAVKSDAEFAAIIGTPVPAVIATDFRALKRMAEKRCGMPVVTCECTGTRLYDAGEEEAYMELIRTFCKNDDEPVARLEGSVGVLGATPLNLSNVRGDEIIRSYYQAQGCKQIYCYGMGDGLDELKKAACVEKNIAVSPSALKAARYMEKEYGIPYTMEYPSLSKDLTDSIGEIENSRVLVIHQQAAANAVRNLLEEKGNDVTVASFFMMDQEFRRDGDVHLDSESQYVQTVEDGDYDVVIGDPLISRAVSSDSYGRWIPFVHFAVSGNLED